MAALFSTVQIEAMQGDNTKLPLQNDSETTQIINKISNILDKSKLDNKNKEKILSNINKINDKYTLGWISYALNQLKNNKYKIEILRNIGKEKINDISKLKRTASLYGNMCMTKNKKTDDVLFDAIKNISQMDENKLYSLSKVLDILPEVAKTENILFNLSNMNGDTLLYLYSVLCSLPENGKTTNILLNIRDMDKFELRDLFDILDKLQYELQSDEIEITQDILLNLSKMDRFILSSLYYLIGKLSFHKITTDVLLNISKITSKDNIYTNMRKNRDVFINVRENIIENIKKDISNIGNNYEEDNEDDKKNRNEYEIICKHMFYALTIVLERLPEEEKTKDILFNISKMNYCTLVSLYLALYYLPENVKTKDILFNISKMDEDKLYYLSSILGELSNALKTEKTLLNISKINNEDTLDKLYNDLKIAINNEEKIQVLNKYGVLQ